MPKLIDFTATVVPISPIETVGANNTQKQKITVDTGEQYRGMAEIEFMGKTVENLRGIQVGDIVKFEGATCGANKPREEGGRLYTSIGGYKVSKV